MSGIYHQIFVNDSYDTPEKIGLLARHMYTKTKPTITKTEAEPILATPAAVEKPDIYYPDKKDTLFWCMYIAKNDLHTYKTITQGYSNIEMEEKQIVKICVAVVKDNWFIYSIKIL